MNFRSVVLGAIGVALLAPTGLQASSFGDLASYVPQPGQPTHEELAAIAAQADVLVAQARETASLRDPEEPSHVVTPYATRALCEAAMTTPVKTEDFNSSLRLSSLWSCASPINGTCAGGCFNTGDIEFGLEVANTSGTIYYSDATFGWTPSDAVFSPGVPGSMRLNFTIPTTTVCMDVVSGYPFTTASTITVAAYDAGGTLLGSGSCGPPASMGSCFIGYKSTSGNIKELRWTGTGAFDGIHHFSFDGVISSTGGSCDLTPIEAKLDSETRFTSDAELAVIEAKLDTETRFTSDAELAVIEAKLDDLAGDLEDALTGLDDLKQATCVSMDLLLTPHGSRCTDSDDSYCGAGEWGTYRGLEGIDTCAPGFTSGLTIDSPAGDTGDSSRLRAGSGTAPAGYELRVYIGTALRNNQVDPLLIMPAREGGFFEQVAQLVKGTVTFYRTYAQEPTALSSTEKLVSEAERLEAEGNLVGAYKAYRDAYQSLTGLLE